MVGIPTNMLPYSIRHSRARGNPGLFCAELAWIPAFAGMTEPRSLFIVHIILSQVFSKEVTKDTKGSDDQISELRAVRVLRGERSLLRLFRWRETGCGIAEYGAMVDAEGFDPALLAEGEADEKTELDQLRSRKKLVQS